MKIAECYTVSFNHEIRGSEILNILFGLVRNPQDDPSMHIIKRINGVSGAKLKLGIVKSISLTKR